MAQQETQVINEALAALRRTAAIEARVLEYEPRRKVANTAALVDADALIEIDVGEQKHLFLAEVKTVDRFETPAQVKARAMTWHQPPLLVAPYITRETADRCRELHLPFIDTAGNAYLQGRGFLIYIVGNTRRVELPRETYRAVTPAGLRVIFALLCQPGLARANYRTIAARAEVALGTIGPVLDDLIMRRFIRIEEDKVRLLNPNQLLQDWVMYYQTTLRPKLKRKRFEADRERLANDDIRQYNAYWGGEMGADKLTHRLRPATFTIYAHEAGKLIAANRMRAKEDGNVEIVDVFWNFPPAQDLPADVAPPPLVYADLMATHDGRNLEIAQLIYEQYIRPTFGQADQAA
jgi:hypothetical protein